jgi:type I restriction enzyme S subunit
MNVIENIPIALPSLLEQRAIAAFLDRETARIDALMEKKQRQIELLQEKRAALISHAVTKGLDPTVKMKPSGVKWLGNIPEHWQVKRIKHVSKVKYGLGEPPDQLEDGLPFIRATDIHRGKINSEAILKVDPQDIPWSRDPELRTNDILVVRSGAYTGDSAIVPEEWAGAIAGYDMVLRVTAAMPQFVAYALLSKYLLYGQIYLERSRAAQPHLNAEELGSFIILLPPKPEQEELVSYLDSETDQSDALMERIKDSINLLREYRTALISAAVTGKIDVREEAA